MGGFFYYSTCNMISAGHGKGFSVAFLNTRGANVLIDADEDATFYSGCRHTGVKHSVFGSIVAETFNITGGLSCSGVCHFLLLCIKIVHKISIIKNCHRMSKLFSLI